MNPSVKWWLEASEAALAKTYGSRLKRMKADLRSADFQFLEIERGRIKARLVRGRQKPVFVKMRTPVLPEAIQRALENEIAGNAGWQGLILGGGLPVEMEQFLNARGYSAALPAPESWTDEADLTALRHAENYRACVLLKFMDTIKREPSALLGFLGIDRGILKADVPADKRPAGPQQKDIHADLTDAGCFWQERSFEDIFREAEEKISSFRNPVFADRFGASEMGLKKLNAELLQMHLRVQVKLHE